MGSGREGSPMPAPIGEGKPRRKSGGGITNSMYHHMIGKDQVLGLKENNVCKSNGNNRPIDLDLGNAVSTPRVSAATLKRLRPKNIANGLPLSQFESKQQQQQCEEGGVAGRRKTRLNVVEGRERSPLNCEGRKGKSQEEEHQNAEQLESPRSISKVKTLKRKNSRSETTEGIGSPKQAIDHQPNGRLTSRSGRFSSSSRIETVDMGGGQLALLDTGRSTRQLGPSRPHKRKTPEPNATISQPDLDPVDPHSISPDPHFDPKPIYTHEGTPIPHIEPESIHPHSIPPILHFEPEPIYPQDLSSNAPPHSKANSRDSSLQILSPSPEFTDPEPIISPIHHLCLQASNPHPETPLPHPPPLEASDHPHPITLEKNGLHPHPITVERNGLQAPEPTKASPYLPRRARRTCTELSEEPNRLQYMVDLIMWRDTPKSALLFGFGSFCVLSSSFAQDLHFSLVTFASYLALIYLAVVFFYKTLLRRGAIEQDNSLTNYELISEADALWVLRSTLPTVNLALSKFQKLFSGDPATTMKLASVLWVLAKCGHTMTLWTLAKFSFFAIFIIPKLYKNYSTQLHGYGRFMLDRFQDAWNTCSHKKGVAVGVFLLIWNLSTVTARLWGAFILIVGLRLYQQSLRTNFDNELDNEQVDHLEENIQIPEAQTGQVSKLELMRIPQEVF